MFKTLLSLFTKPVVKCEECNQPLNSSEFVVCHRCTTTSQHYKDINTYDGVVRGVVEICGIDFYITESAVRPPKLRWEASDRDGNPSFFAGTRSLLVQEIQDYYL